MQALSVRKVLARILKMCLWNCYSSENVTENIVKPMSIYERVNYLGFCHLGHLQSFYHSCSAVTPKYGCSLLSLNHKIEHVRE